MSQDFFNDSNGTSLSTHDANWTAVSAQAIAQIQSNNARPNSTFNYCAQYYNGSQRDYSEITLAPQGTANAEHRGVIIRGTSTQFGYQWGHLTISGSNFTVAQLNKNGSFLSNSSTYSQPWNTQHYIDIEYTGGHVYGRIADVLVLDYTDGSPPTAGYDGFWTWAQATLDADLDVQDWNNGITAGPLLLLSQGDSL